MINAVKRCSLRLRHCASGTHNPSPHTRPLLGWSQRGALRYGMRALRAWRLESLTRRRRQHTPPRKVIARVLRLLSIRLYARHPG